MKKTFVIILTLIGFLTFGQENQLDLIENEVNSINSDSTYTELKFEVNNGFKNNDIVSKVLKIWHRENKIFKIEQNVTLNYGEIRSTLFLRNNIPIKIVETENENYWLPDSLVQIKGYDIGIRETYKANSYILDWKKNKRKLIFSGKPTGNAEISIEWSKYIEILRESLKLVSE